MNEITKIHLGRQGFSVAVDAHKALQEYLRAIKKHMGDTDEAVEEVELRMAELLTERGISGDKVVLLKDVDYLKEQLGEPGDFGDEESESAQGDNAAPRRLFRDTENAMLAGVCAGIAKYFNVDAVWVRLAFVGLVLLGASGILLYIVLWLVVPEAKTSSERLQMQGKPVTVEALKDVVERADVKGAAERATSAVGKVVNSVLKVLLALVGVVLMLMGVIALLGLTTASVYLSLNRDFVPGGIFPVGGSEVLLLGLAGLAAAIVAIFFVITGRAVVNRKWPLPGWALGAMIVVFLASIAVGCALAADAAPKIRDRFEASQQIYTRTVEDFNKLRVVGEIDAGIRYEESSNPAVIVKYWGSNTDFSARLASHVQDQTLTVDLRALDEPTNCKTICIFHPPITEVIIRGPKLQEVSIEQLRSFLTIPEVGNQVLKVRANGGEVRLSDVIADSVRAELGNDGVWTLAFMGVYQGDADQQQEIVISASTAAIGAKNLDIKFDGQCGVVAENDTAQYLTLLRRFDKLVINGQVINSIAELRAIQDKPGRSAYECVQPADPYFTDNW